MSILLNLNGKFWGYALATSVLAFSDTRSFLMGCVRVAPCGKEHDVWNVMEGTGDMVG